jgi:uncharacterized membrane protein (UPF0136 family)
MALCDSAVTNSSLPAAMRVSRPPDSKPGGLFYSRPMEHPMKYEFVPGDEITIAPGRTLKRIRALVAIAVLGIAPGDLGGYLEKESNLSQVSGNAWVYGDGLIFWASKVGTENGTLTVYAAKTGDIEVTRGCFRGAVSEFLAASEAHHDDDTKHEYRLLIEVAQSRITRALAKNGGAA